MPSTPAERPPLSPLRSQSPIHAPTTSCSAASLAPPAPQAGWPLPSARALRHPRSPPAPCALNCVTAAHRRSRSPPQLAAAPHWRRCPGLPPPLAAPARLIALADYIFSASCGAKLHGQTNHSLTSSLSRSPGIINPPLPPPSSTQVKPIINPFGTESSLTGTFCPLPPLSQNLAFSLAVTRIQTFRPTRAVTLAKG